MAAVERQGGPVRKEQDAVPIADAMQDYLDRAMLSFSIPAHAGGRGPAPEFTKWAGMDAARFDLPMSHGVDTRDRAWGVQSAAQELFAEAVGAKQTFFSTNGSSLSAHVAIMAVAGPGDTLVMARNGHKSAFAGLVMSGARPAYVDPFYDEDLELALDPLPRDIEAALEAHPEAKALLVFTPSYYGTSADVPEIVPPLGRVGADRHRASAALLRARGVDECIGASPVEHRRRAAPVRAGGH
jgi:arginine decarboxylase